MLDELFTLFLKEKQYMHNNTPKTIRYFECSFKAFKRANITELSKESIINFVAHMRQSGLSARSCNDYSKGGTVAVAAVATTVLLGPQGLLWGLNKGKPAIIPAGNKYTVYVDRENTVSVIADSSKP